MPGGFSELPVYETELRTRAFENQLFIAACNRSGREGEYTFFGRSTLVGPDGAVLAQADDRENVVVMAEMDLTTPTAPGSTARSCGPPARPVYALIHPINCRNEVINMEFSYFMPVRLIFGSNVVDQLGATAKNYGKHALIVTGRGSTKRSGLLDRAIALLEKEGVQATVFNKVEPNPLTTTVMEGAALAREKGCDLVIGMGGGSMMDAAKAVAFCAVNDGDVSDYISGSKQGTGCLPILEVPTTCGTGSEANPFAVLTNPETKDKKSLWGDLIYPKVSFIDPEL